MQAEGPASAKALRFRCCGADVLERCGLHSEGRVRSPALMGGNGGTRAVHRAGPAGPWMPGLGKGFS